MVGETDQIHSVPRRADQADITDSIKRTQLLKFDTPMHKMNRHKFDRPKSPINPSHQLINRSSQILILLDILSRGDGYLDEDDFADPFGMFGEEDFEGV